MSDNAITFCLVAQGQWHTYMLVPSALGIAVLYEGQDVGTLVQTDREGRFPGPFWYATGPRGQRVFTWLEQAVAWLALGEES